MADAKPAEQVAALAEPSAGHARLAPLVGLWDTTTRVFTVPDTRPVEVDGSVEKSWVLGGRFIREDLAGVSSHDMPYMGLGFLGYDNCRHVYHSVWMSTGSTSVTTASGTWDPARRRIVLTGEELDAAGNAPRRFKAVLVITSDTRHSLTQSYVGDDGVFRLGFEIVYTRSG